MPNVDLFIWATDLLASRYGWSLRDICKLYWEEFWEMVKIASNVTVAERNSEYKFHFMLHATKESAKQWKDSPLPFPDKVEKADPTGISQLPIHLRKNVKRNSKV